jgi:hypothetical protein
MPHPTRPCRCAVGRHTAAADIDAALASGDSLNVICARWPTGFSRSGLGTHRLRCLGIGAKDTVQASSGTTASVHASTDPDVLGQDDAVPLSTPPPRKRRIGELPPGAPTKEQRVVHIINLMARLEWVSGQTGGELAELWGIHPGTVEHDACEASRAVQRQVDPGAVQATVMAALHEALGLGLDFARTKVIDGRTREGDPKALNSIALLAKSMAVFAPAPVRGPALATNEREITVHYPEGVPAHDGSPPQPSPGTGAPSPRSTP